MYFHGHLFLQIGCTKSDWQSLSLESLQTSKPEYKRSNFCVVISQSKTYSRLHFSLYTDEKEKK